MRFWRVESWAACSLVIALTSCSSTPTNSGISRGGTRVLPPAAAPPAGVPLAGTGAGLAAAGGVATDPGFGSGDNPNGGAVIMAPKSGGTAGTGLKEGQCARQDVVTMRLVPTIWLVLDGSGSMLDPLGDKSRFDALKEALMDPMAGVVKSLERSVKWGYIMYDGPGGGAILPDGGVATFTSPVATTCPRVLSVEPKKDNYMDIAAMYPPDPLGGSTPTDKALETVIAHLPNGGAPMLDAKVNPTIVVLATDGAPNDFCSASFLPIDVRPNVIAAVQTLAQKNIKTYVISLAGDDALLTQHLTQVAQAGMTGKPPFIPANKEQLVQTFKDIIGPDTACDIVLSGKVKMGRECMGKLDINGIPLPCGSDNGWILKDESTVSITGEACMKYKMDDTAILHADFPCEIFSLN